MLGDLVGIVLFVFFLYLVLKFLGLGIRIFWLVLKWSLIFYLGAKILSLLLLL